MPDLNIFPDTHIIDIQKSRSIDAFINKYNIKDTRIRLMPGCNISPERVSGITIRTNRTISPDLLGSDIGCGILVAKLGNTDIDTDKLDNIIKENIPCGRNIHTESPMKFDFENDKPYTRFERCLGTLGGGGHFIELCADDDGNKFFIVHSGSRGYGMMVSYCYNHNNYFSETDRKNDYYNNLRICMRFAKQNRRLIADIVLGEMGIKAKGFDDIPHNYFDTNTGILRKNAVDASKDKDVFILLGRGEGCLVGKGLGCEAFNFSAPSSREDENQSMDTFISSLSGTIEKTAILKPVYNFRP
ncbi:MAG: RtcB family protein [Firmicutes bacterium]|nr:RtcB family protein [Bacillota bacterium]